MRCPQGTRQKSGRTFGIRPSLLTFDRIHCMYVVYLIQNEEANKIYIGVTANLKRRLDEHNSGGNKYTTGKGKWNLIYAEAYRSKEDAYLRERRLKNHGSGKIELFKRLKNSLLDIKSEEGRS